MATDLGQIVANLTSFYDFAGSTVVGVGAGGGQLVEFARAAGRVIAVERDAAALERLFLRARERGLDRKIEPCAGDFLAVRPRGDVVLFEFCLHEMPDPARALGHAAGLAPDVLVLDHAPGSRWSWYAAEEAEVEAAWSAVESLSVRRRRDVEAFQSFRDFAGLEAKLAGQAARSRERIAPLRRVRPISIPMPYRLVLL
jgi:hypothetical protein